MGISANDTTNIFLMTDRSNGPFDLVFYHSPCFDGHAAAWVAWTRALLAPGVEFVAANYGDKNFKMVVSTVNEAVEKLGRPKVLFVDYSVPSVYMRDIARVADVFVIDHHKTAKNDLFALAMEGLVDVAFNTSKSGAGLAWDILAPRAAETPALLQAIEDRDLWKFDLPHSKELVAWLSSEDWKNFMNFSGFMQEIELSTPHPFGEIGSANRYVREGAAVLRKQQLDIDTLVGQAMSIKLGKHAVPVVNCPHFLASEVGNALIMKFQSAPFAATFYYAANGWMNWSLRSADDRVDVSEVAKGYGGGGHRNASGFTSPPEVPFYFDTIDKLSSITPKEISK